MSSVVAVNPKILGGTPVFVGTRVPVESLFDYLKRGRSVDYFLEQFPTVKREQVELLLDDAKRDADTSTQTNCAGRSVAAGVYRPHGSGSELLG